MLKTLLAAVLAVTPMSLPPPTGAKPIGTVAVHLIDRSRPDPWVATENARELMAQIWYPARWVGVLLCQAGLPAEQIEPMIGAIDGERSVAV
ncbi:hypothetical protein [Actinoplanes flavus]|uniref:Uncharacterized protein n=1 Tax=Actinoplanes flavus TaxID=2820290 RepID=A0ABS3UPI1_9ACTN|nr:hypothetical protein [Actinoplanes flavus]MBO3740146.1 hypothetical protein [Actinoplanes flavus]